MAPGHLDPEVLPHARHRHHRHRHRTTAPSSRCWATSASATTSRRRPSRWPGSSSPRSSASTATASGSRSTRATTRPSSSGSTRSGVRPERIQRMGDEDNFWAMGDTGPVRPRLGDLLRQGGRLRPRRRSQARRRRSASSRSGTSSSCSSTETPQGALTELPRKNIDTGAGLERILPILQGLDSIFDTDLFAADHRRGGLGPRRPPTGPTRGPTSRCACWPTTGAPSPCWWPTASCPANEGRGYVLRRVVRRAVMAARRPGSTSRSARRWCGRPPRCWARPTRRWWPQHDLIVNVVAREEAGFDRTLRAGLSRLEEAFGHRDEGARRRRGLHPARHPRLPGRADRGAGPRRRGRGRPGGIRRRHGRAARAGPRRGEGDPGRRRGGLPGAARGRGADDVRRAGSRELRGAGAGPRRARRQGRGRRGRRRATRSRSSWTARRSTPRAAVRSATPARS